MLLCRSGEPAYAGANEHSRLETAFLANGCLQTAWLILTTRFTSRRLNLLLVRQTVPTDPPSTPWTSGLRPASLTDDELSQLIAGGNAFRVTPRRSVLEAYN